MSAAILSVRDLSRAFGGLRAVDGLSFEVSAGTIVGLIGPNGSGKTTALNLISGAIAPSGGSVRFVGREIAGLAPHRIRRLGLARTFQLVRVFRSMTVRENVLAGITFAAPGHRGSDSPQVDALLTRVGLEGQQHRLAAELTYIDQKRLELARALAGGPALLLLDEWLAGLNPTELAVGVELIRALREQKLSILLVEHVMDAIRQLCDHCVVMNAGAKIAEGTPQEVLVDPAVVSAYLGGDGDA